MGPALCRRGDLGQELQADRAWRGLALKIAGPEVPPLARLQAAEIAAEPQLAPSPARAAQARRLLPRDVASLRACAEVS